MSVKKEKVELDASTDFVTEAGKLDKSLGFDLKFLKIKTKEQPIKFSVQSTQAHIRIGEIKAAALPVKTKGIKAMVSPLKDAVFDAKSAKDDKIKKKNIKTLQKLADTLSKNAKDAYEAKMKAHWKAIAKAELDAEKAVEAAEKQKKKDDKKKPKLSKTKWVKLIKTAYGTKKTVKKGGEAVNTMCKSALLSANAFQTEALRVKAEESKGTDAETIKQQRGILANAYVKQLKGDLAKVVVIAKKLDTQITKILTPLSGVNADAHKGLKVYDDAKSAADEMIRDGVNFAKVLRGIEGNKDGALKLAEKIATGQESDPKKLLKDMKEDFNLEANYSLFMQKMENTEKAVKKMLEKE